jgi:hypothetical protein
MIGLTNEFKEMLIYIKNKFKKNYDNKLKDFKDNNFITEEIYLIKKNILKYFTFAMKPKANLVQRKYKYFEPQCTLLFETSEQY